MLQTIDGDGAAAARKKRISAKVDTTSWEPDFDEPDFATNGITPKIVSPSGISCKAWEFSDNEIEAINQYNNKAHSSKVSSPQALRESDKTALITNVTALNITPDSERKRHSRLSKAKEKYEKYVKSPRDAKKLEELAREERRQEVRGAAARRKERRESGKDKFKKMIRYKCNTPPKPVVSPDTKIFDPWLMDTTPKEEEYEEWENAAEEWKYDEAEDPPTLVEKQWKEDEDEAPPTPVRRASTDSKNQDIFRPRAQAKPAVPSPSSKDLNDVLKDVQSNLEVSAITKTSSFLLDETADFEDDFNLQSTPINLRDRDFQSKIDEKIADTEGEAEKPASQTGKMSFLTCGVINGEAVSPKQVIVDFTRDIKTGVKNSVRNFFGQCDVGEGADVLAKNLQETKETWKVNVNSERDHTKEYVAFGYKQ